MPRKGTVVRELTYAQAVHEALELALAADPAVYVMGLGVPDPGGVFGTTRGLSEIYGENRVMDMPIAENGMTGIALGSALAGMRPVLTHQRVDFMLLSLDQLVNQAAKWHYMFDGRMKAPLVVRGIIGRGWGQGPQHSQSLHSWFAHVPGLKTIMPFTPADAKGMLLSAIEDDNPVVMLEHRWLLGMKGPVEEGMYRTRIGQARIARSGKDVTIVAVSHMVYEALRAASVLESMGVSAEVVDVRTLRPLDGDTILASVRRTGRLVVADPDWGFCGFSAELLALAAERAFPFLQAPPRRVTWPEHPQPTSPALSVDFYPGPGHIAEAVLDSLGREAPCDLRARFDSGVPHDVPDLSFSGPF